MQTLDIESAQDSGPETLAAICESHLDAHGALPGPLARMIVDRFRAARTARFVPEEENSTLLGETDDGFFAARAEVTLDRYGWLPPQVASDSLRRLGRAAARPARSDLTRAATRDEVVAHAERLKALAAQAGLSALRVGPSGALVVHDPAQGLRGSARFHTEASQLLGAWVRVITDDAPAAAGSAGWPRL